MPRWAKTVIAVLLLPVCLGSGGALARLLQEIGASGREPGTASLVWVPLSAGAACWWVIYLLLPKPMWAYVFGHELTHALWTWLFGGRVRRFKATARGGHVVVTRTNFLIVLAPYFFPLYAVLLLGLYGLGTLIWKTDAYRVWFLLGLGATYAFHVTLTWHTLKTEQTDITSQGYLFSAVVVWLGNVGILLLGLPLLFHLPLARVGDWWLTDTWTILATVSAWLRS